MLQICLKYIMLIIKSKLRLSVKKNKDNLDAVDRCVVIPSNRSNHIGRLVPYIKENPATYGVFTTTRLSIKFEKKHQVNWIYDSTGQCLIEIKLLHFYKAKKELSEITKKIPIDFTRKQKLLIFLYLSEFHVWVELWNKWLLASRPKQIITTFECSSSAKALFYVARQLGIPSRIHWYGGMRHAVLQSTLATDLWCQTKNDAEYFKRKVPIECNVEVKENPETQRLAKEIGILNSNAPVPVPMNFLFLGPGANPIYTKAMRIADLKVIKAIQDIFSDKIVWRMRPHPSRIDRFVGELKEAGVIANDISTRPLNDDLKWAHAVGTATSTLLLDLSKTGRHLFWVQARLRTISSVDEHVSNGIGKHLCIANAEHHLNYIFNK